MPADRRTIRGGTAPDANAASRSPQRQPGERASLLHPEWRYVEKFNMNEFRSDDWALLNRQRAQYLHEQQAAQVLALLKASQDAPTFGYAINHYEHCLQTATLLHRDGYDEETVVTGLLHDIGFIVCPQEHGKFAADLLRAYISDKNIWMLERHEIFQRVHLHGNEGCDDAAFVNERDRWRGHPFFEWTVLFVEHYDIAAIDPTVENLAIEYFEPMVQRVFSVPR